MNLARLHVLSLNKIAPQPPGSAKRPAALQGQVFFVLGLQSGDMAVAARIAEEIVSRATLPDFVAESGPALQDVSDYQGGLVRRKSLQSCADEALVGTLLKQRAQHLRRQSIISSPRIAAQKSLMVFKDE